MSDRGGSTNPAPLFTGKTVKGNPVGRGGATNSTGFGPIGTKPLGTDSTNNDNSKLKVGQPASED